MRFVRELSLAVAAALLVTACGKTESPATKPGTQPTTKAVVPAIPTITATAAAPATLPASAPATIVAATKPVDPAKLDDQGYIRQWLVLAPIGFGDNYNAEDIDKETIPNEAAMTPKVGDKVKVSTEEGEPGAYKTVQKDLTWTSVVTEDFIVDFNAELKLDTSDAVGGYAVAYLEAPEEMKGITFSWCSNDNGKIYLNGKSVASYVGGRSISEDADVAENLTLNKGVNLVVFKVWNDSNNWQGCIRLLNKDGKPVTNVKVKLTK